MPYVADASFLVDIERQHPGAIELLREVTHAGETLIVPSIVLAEYLAGAKDPAAQMTIIGQSAELRPFTVADAVLAGKRAREHINAGRLPGWLDVLILAHAENQGATVITANAKHFDGIPIRTYR